MEAIGLWATELYWGAHRYFESGGIVMVPLGLVSVWLWLLIILKMIEVSSLWRERPVDGARQEKKHRTSRPNAWPEVLAGRFRSQSTGVMEDDLKLIQRLLVTMSARVERHVGTILILASVAPLIGLLGTVNGMITTFEVISQFGTGNTRALAGGISEALITTQTGLVVALPGLFLGNFIHRRVERIKGSMERFGQSLVSAASHPAMLREESTCVH